MARIYPIAAGFLEIFRVAFLKPASGHGSGSPAGI